MRHLRWLLPLLALAVAPFAQAATAAYRNEVLADNPLTYWQFDETSGTTAADAAGTPQNGTYHNITLGAASGFPNLGTCGTFNGSNSRVVVPFHSSFNLGSGNFSVECWYKTTVSGRGDIYNFKGSGDFGIFANQAGSGSIGGYHDGFLPGYFTTINEWHHVVYVRSGTTITLYVDGQVRATGSDSQQMSSNADIVIGANQTAIYFTGQIDEVAYYNTALSGARVLAHYNVGAQIVLNPPTVTNTAASNLFATSATIGANVTDTGGQTPDLTLFYGTTDGGTTPGAWQNNVSLGPQSGAASTNLSNLSQGAAYFFRARAVNTAGTAWAPGTANFSTPVAAAPVVQNLAPLNVTATSAHLRGQITNTGNQPPSITIYYGTTDGGTNVASWQGSLTLPGTHTGAFTAPVTGLTPSSTYFYRARAQNVAGAVWAPNSQSFGTPVYVIPNVVINELHIAEDDRTIHSEFIELYNAGTAAADLSGWYFDKGINFTLPVGTTLAAGAYLVLCEDPATMQSRYGVSGPHVVSWQDTPTPQYTLLSNNGERLTIRDTLGNNIDEVEYGMGFPWPTVGDAASKSMELIHPSLDNNLGGHWRSSNAGPTPGAPNSVFTTNAPPAIRQVDHAPTAPVVDQTWMLSGQIVRITAKVTDPNNVQSVVLQYQIVEPGDFIKIDDARYTAAASWTNVSMGDAGAGGDQLAGDFTYSCLIPASVQTHRRLIRYRITVTDALGASVRVPYADDPQPNFAYFIYDAIPAWSGSRQPGSQPVVNYSSTVLSSLQQYHLITRVEEHANAQYVPVIKADGTTQNPAGGSYGGEDYLWKGALCFDGKVYDHIRFRARGGVWRYAMGKNMWKFDFNRGHDFQGRDNYGKSYDQKWKKLNFSSIIQQGDFGSRGEQGLYESVGFRLFQLTGMPAEDTHYVHFRIIERPNETNSTPNNQFDDDFQGLYLAIEQEDGQMLDAHGLPDGNLYKMEGGTGELNHQGATLPKDKSDLNAFLSYGTTEQWWRDHCDLPNYYNYRAIVDCIHHYDIGDGKNYFFFHNATTHKWTALPWDLDLTWADNAYRADSGIAGLSPSGNSTEPFFSRVFGNNPPSTGIAALRMEHRNRVREILDLLFTPEQTGMLIDELASFIYQPGVPSLVDADRAMWDYNPILASGYVNSSKAGHGRFYQSAVDNPSTPASELNTFPGMIQRMRNYVNTRRTVITNQILTSAEENLVPTTPTISVTGGPATSIPTNALSFTSTAFIGKNGATFSAMKWRVAEITNPAAPGYLPYDHTNRRLYEADPANTWESPEIPTFSANYQFPSIAARVGHTYRARVKHRDSTGRWSHWSAPVLFTASQPSDVSIYLQSLVISKILYRPATPTPAEQVIAQDEKSYEWIELMNVGPAPIDLTPIRFTKGVDFDFAGSAVTTLNPGTRVVVVNKIAAFNARYAAQFPGVPIAGEWDDGDSLNNDGEQLKLSHGAGTPIRDFVYGVTDPWPTEPALGRALVLISPYSIPDHASPASWRASATAHGTPAAGDGTTYAQWAAGNGFTNPALDEDGDDLANFGEYTLVGSPAANSQIPLPQGGTVTIEGERYLTLTFRHNENADDVGRFVEASTDLLQWHSDAAHVLFHSKVDHDDGTATLTYRCAHPFDESPKQSMRLRMTSVGP